MEYSQLAACTLHLRRVDPERLNNDDQVEKQRIRLRQLCQLMDLDPIDINIKRSVKRKGQAFITFSSPADAATAQALLNGFQMVKGGRNIEAEIARIPADIMVEKFCSAQELEEHIKRRKADKGTDFLRSLETTYMLTIPHQIVKRPPNYLPPAPPPQHPPRPNAPATSHPPPGPQRPSKRRPSSPTSTSHPTTRSTCATSPKNTTSRLSKRSSVGILDSGKSARSRCRSSRIVRLWSMRRTRGPFRRGRR
jgi:RNA recognition motif-containing protein